MPSPRKKTSFSSNSQSDSGDILDRVKRILSVDTDQDLAAHLRCHRTQISRIRKNGFPNYVASLLELLLPFLEPDSTEKPGENKRTSD